MNENMTRIELSNTQRRALSIDEIAAEYGVSPGLVRLEIQRDQLKATRMGRRILIMRAELERYLAAREGR